MRKDVLILFSMLMFLLISMVNVDALTLKISDTTGYIGKTVTIPVDIENASNVGSIEFVVIYNSSLLDVKKVEKGSLLKGLISYNSTEEGIIAVNLVDSNGINGDGSIAKITFDILSTDTVDTPLIIQDAKAYDVNTYTELPIDISNGILTISTSAGTGSGQTPGFEMITFLSAFTIMIILLILRKK